VGSKLEKENTIELVEAKCLTSPFLLYFLMIDFNLLAQIVKLNNSFLLSTHVNPDADAIGSEIAFYLVLKKLGKEVYIINHSSTPYFLKFLDTENVIEKFDEVKHSKLFKQVDVLAVIDLNYANRLVKEEKIFRESSRLKICIDHHQNPEKFVDHCFNDTSYAATAHIIFDFIKQTSIVKLTKEIAVPIYAGIMTDLGSFRFERTTPEIHRITAELLDAGVNPVEVYDKIYDQSNFSKIKLLGESLSSIQLNPSGEIAYMIISHEAINRTQADEAEVDGFVNYCLSIRGVKLALLFFELKDGIKISFRSKGKIPVNKLAEKFGGGGHLNASGTKLINVNLDETVGNVVKAAEDFLIGENFK
jgi:phosphoesterase RecJ-like protein